MKYVVKWNETESLTPRLESQNLECEVVCESLEEARSIFEDELEATNLEKVSELEFEPSEREWRSCVTTLSIYDKNGWEVEVSEHYWIEL